jgi:signal transduction histidine kinase
MENRRRKRKGLGLGYDIIVSLMGVVSFLFSYVGISLVSIVFELNLSPEAINVVSVGIFILISWYGLGIIINHRTMGPMGAVKRHFSIVANGDYYLKFSLRKGDDLKYVTDFLNNMTESLIQSEQDSINRLSSLKKEMEDTMESAAKEGDSSETISKVKNIVHRLENIQ